jgi:hypothetical protein
MAHASENDPDYKAALAAVLAGDIDEGALHPGVGGCGRARNLGE